ncbi:hypothetical protein [Bacillus pseudomycoides]|uniref:hypothetical protein n=1 Tax=Bacillus pseudomycoides TaxID=64104 RepID=UPI001FB23A95|nr:hypothetical protein [Bacillus pseudomycoides]
MEISILFESVEEFTYELKCTTGSLMFAVVRSKSLLHFLKPYRVMTFVTLENKEKADLVKSIIASNKLHVEVKREKSLIGNKAIQTNVVKRWDVGEFIQLDVDFKYGFIYYLSMEDLKILPAPLSTEKDVGLFMDSMADTLEKFLTDLFVRNIETVTV